MSRDERQLADAARDLTITDDEFLALLPFVGATCPNTPAQLADATGECA